MPETGTLRWLDSEDYQPLDDRNVGWWIDHFWVNGQCMDMATNSGSEDHGSEVPGEIVRTEYWRLDNIDVALDGKVEIAMPIGERQPLEEYSFKNHPEKYDKDCISTTVVFDFVRKTAYHHKQAYAFEP